jgi:hypothetical protein
VEYHDRSYRVINVPTALESLMGAHGDFGRTWEKVTKDILFLIQKYPQVVYSARNKVPLANREAFINHLKRTNDPMLKKAKMALGAR